MVPVHNCAPYLTLALSEVVAQLAGRDDAEIVVVDDASTDDPAAVVQRLGRGRVRYVANPHNLGAIGTFNRCVELASGEFVHLLHGDDAVLPGFYDAMEQALADPDVVAAVCRTRYIDADGTPGPTSRSYRTGTGVWTGALEAQAVSNRIRPPGIVVRRSVYERIGGYREDLPHATDWEMWTPLGMVSQYLPPHRRLRTTRRGLIFAAVFATRTAASLARNGDVRGAARQLWEAMRCLVIAPRGVP